LNSKGRPVEHHIIVDIREVDDMDSIEAQIGGEPSQIIV
jgi:hypothetical protein